MSRGTAGAAAGILDGVIDGNSPDILFFRLDPTKKTQVRFFRSPAFAPRAAYIQNGPYSERGRRCCVAGKTIAAYAGCERSANHWREARRIRGTEELFSDFCSRREADDSAIFRTSRLFAKHPVLLGPTERVGVKQGHPLEAFFVCGDALLPWAAAASHSRCRNRIQRVAYMSCVAFTPGSNMYIQAEKNMEYYS